MKKLVELCDEQREVYAFTKDEIDKILSVASILSLGISNGGGSELEVEPNKPVEEIVVKKSKRELRNEKIRENPFIGLNAANKAIIREFLTLQKTGKLDEGSMLNIFDIDPQKIIIKYGSDNSRFGGVLRKLEDAGVCETRIRGLRKIITHFKLYSEYFQ